MDIKYEIQFHTDWHCGSGLSAGADVDALVIKTKDDLPFVPGKTIKGLVREAVEELGCFECADQDNFLRAFGTENTSAAGGLRGTMFFTDALLNAAEGKAIVSKKIARYMYRTLASTSIGPDGTAEEHSLRKIQVTVPCILEGEILNVPDEIQNDIKRSLKYIKRLGQNRNRGLGRCTFTIK